MPRGRAAYSRDREAGSEQDLRARELVLRYGWNSTVYQLMNPDIHHWFAPDGDALIGYVEHGGVRVVAGAPVAAYERLPAAAQNFEAEGRRRGLTTCYFGVEPRWLELVGARSEVALIGAQPVWDAGAWARTFDAHPSLRAQLNRARNKGVQVQAHAVSELRFGPNAPALRAVRGRWVASHGLPPMGFLTAVRLLPSSVQVGGPLDADRRLYVARRDGAVVGYLVASPIPARNGWLIEQVVRDPGAPNGTNELLIDHAARDLASLGAGRLTLGLSPLSRRHRPDRAVRYDSAPWLRFVFAWAHAHGRRFYDFAGLEAFKEKFRPPIWEPVYLVAGGGKLGPRALHAVAAAFMGGRPALALARGVARTYGADVKGWLRGLSPQPGRGPHGGHPC